LNGLLAVVCNLIIKIMLWTNRGAPCVVHECAAVRTIE
jgi:hypothetical protein